MNSSNKRTGIVTPLKITDPRHDVKCQICINEDRSRWAFGLCQLCDKFICKEHMVVIRNQSYCNPCRNDPNSDSSQILNAVDIFEQNEKKHIYNKILYYLCKLR